MDSRKQFQDKFSVMPYEFEMDRFNEDEAWPGNYRNYHVQCAFEGWQAGRASMRDQAVTNYGCHMDLEELQQPDKCVLDTGRKQDCFYARKYGDDARNHCGEWKSITIQP